MEKQNSHSEETKFNFGLIGFVTVMVLVILVYMKMG